MKAAVDAEMDTAARFPNWNIWFSSNKLGAIQEIMSLKDPSPRPFLSSTLPSSLGHQVWLWKLICAPGPKLSLCLTPKMWSPLFPSLCVTESVYFSVLDGWLLISLRSSLTLLSPAPILRMWVLFLTRGQWGCLLPPSPEVAHLLSWPPVFGPSLGGSHRALWVSVDTPGLDLADGSWCIGYPPAISWPQWS